MIFCFESKQTKYDYSLRFIAIYITLCSKLVLFIIISLLTTISFIKLNISNFIFQIFQKYFYKICKSIMKIILFLHMFWKILINCFSTACQTAFLWEMLFSKDFQISPRKRFNIPTKNHCQAAMPVWLTSHTPGWFNNQESSSAIAHFRGCSSICRLYFKNQKKTKKFLW